MELARKIENIRALLKYVEKIVDDGNQVEDPDTLSDLTAAACDDTELESMLQTDFRLNAVTWEFEENFEEGNQLDYGKLLKALVGYIKRKSVKNQFVGIVFCKECYNMCYPVAERGVLKYACKQCKFGYSEDAWNPCVFVSRTTQSVDALAQVNPDVIFDPTLKRTLDRSRNDTLVEAEPTNDKMVQCPKCGYDVAVYFQTQSNREKAGMQLFYVCCNTAADDGRCGYKWFDKA